VRYRKRVRSGADRNRSLNPGGVMSYLARIAATAAAVVAVGFGVAPAAMAAAAAPTAAGTVHALGVVTPDYTCAEHIECDPK
jgi:hypothetical protein